MATEIRRLVFSHSETTLAIREYGRKFGTTFPSGKVVRARFTENIEQDSLVIRQFKTPLHGDYNIQESAKGVTVTFFNEKTFEQKFFNLSADFISGALIEYAIRNKIMLPKKAKKDLDITEFNVCLDISLDSRTEGDAPNSGLALDE